MRKERKFFEEEVEKKLPSQKLRMKDTELHPVFYTSLHLKFIILYLVSTFSLSIFEWVSIGLWCAINQITLNWWKINGLLLKFIFLFDLILLFFFFFYYLSLLLLILISLEISLILFHTLLNFMFFHVVVVLLMFLMCDMHWTKCSYLIGYEMKFHQSFYFVENIS